MLRAKEKERERGRAARNNYPFSAGGHGSLRDIPLSEDNPREKPAMSRSKLPAIFAKITRNMYFTEMLLDASYKIHSPFIASNCSLHFEHGKRLTWRSSPLNATRIFLSSFYSNKSSSHFIKLLIFFREIFTSSFFLRDASCLPTRFFSVGEELAKGRGRFVSHRKNVRSAHSNGDNTAAVAMFVRESSRTKEANLEGRPRGNE